MVALPSLVPFVQFLKRSGYLEARQSASQFVYPIDHWRSFFAPDRLGNPAYKDWIGDPRLGPLNNYFESTVYLGLLTIPFAVAGVFARRARARWFWLACAAFVLACIFGAPGLRDLVARLPGFKFTSLARVALLLPLPAGYLAAAGSGLLRRRPLLIDAAAVLIAFDLALLAGRFYPYLEPETTKVPVTPMVEFMRRDHAPFRIAPFFDYFWPNTAELVRVEDVRSHFGSELAYRKMLVRIDPTAWGGSSTVLTFNSLKFNFNDRLTRLLGIRWYVEHNVIDIIKWSIFATTVPGVKETGTLPLKPGAVLQRTIHVDAEPFWAIELPVHLDEEKGRGARLEVALTKNGETVWSRAFTKADANVMSKLYVPLRPYARLGETVVLHVRSVGLRGWMLEGANPTAGETRLFYGRVTTPVIFDRELPDGRLFRNLAELPRFRAVSKLRKLNDDEFLAARDVDFEEEAVITDDPVMPPELSPAKARVTLTSYAPDEQRITTESDAPFFLASSEKLTPELAIAVDGRAVRPIEVDMLFAGVTMPAGRHEVVFSRRIARGWWWVAGVGVGLWLIAAMFDVWAWRRRASTRPAEVDESRVSREPPLSLTLSPPLRGEGTEPRQNRNRRFRQHTIALSPRRRGEGTG